MPHRSTLNLAAIALIPLANCATTEAAPPAPPRADACLPASLAQFVGQPADAKLQARMLSVTGKTVLRLVKPGTMVTARAA